MALTLQQMEKVKEILGYGIKDLPGLSKEQFNKHVADAMEDLGKGYPAETTAMVRLSTPMSAEQLDELRRNGISSSELLRTMGYQHDTIDLQDPFDWRYFADKLAQARFNEQGKSGGMTRDHAA